MNKAKYSYFYLLSLVSLIFLSISLGLILFNIINIVFSDGLILRTYDSQLKFSISALLVSAPVYYLTQHFIGLGFVKNEFLRDSNLRKWLIYLILLVSSVIILGLLINLFNNFLSGELTVKFALKSLTVFFLSSFIFCYYLYNLSKNQKKVFQKIFLYSSIAIILAIFVSAFFFIESPKVARDRKHDQHILSNVHNLEALINEYYNVNESLPGNLEDIKNFNNRIRYFNDNILTYIDYILIDETDFKLCATMKLDSDSMFRENYQAGYHCFSGNLWLRK